MIKQTLAIVLLLSFITVNFSKVFIWLNYELNKKEITEKYCVNKDKPCMHCCGKCHMQKKMAEDDEKQKSPAMPDIKNDIQLFGSAIRLKINKGESTFFVRNTLYTGAYLPGVHSSVFHPPQIA